MASLTRKPCFRLHTDVRTNNPASQTPFSGLEHCCHNIQDAVDAAVTGDRNHRSNGTYNVVDGRCCRHDQPRGD